jgi:DNA-binding CsgD family transcriptional regulator
MEHPGFFHRAGPFPLHVIAKSIGAELSRSADGARIIADLRTLRQAGPGHLTFFDNRKYIEQLKRSEAEACILSKDFVNRVPGATATLMVTKPYDAFARALNLFYVDGLRSKAAAAAADRTGILVHPSAEIAEDVTIEPGAVIAREAMIGSGTTVAAGAVVGYRVGVAMSHMYDLSHDEFAPQRRLTQREIDIVSLIAVGRSNKAIAIELGVAPETVKTHLKRIFLKLSAHTRAEAVVRARSTRNSFNTARPDLARWQPCDGSPV